MKNFGNFLKKASGVIMFYFIIIFLFYSCMSLKQNQHKINHSVKMSKIYDNNTDTPFPNQNFIYLQKSLNDLTVEDENNDITLSSASGIIIDRRQNTLYGLTASHWCEEINDPEFYAFTHFLGYHDDDEVRKSIKIKADYYGLVYDIDIIAMDKEGDVCIFKFNSDYANKAQKIRIADDYPNIGEKIYTASAPLAVKGPNIRLHFDGYFSGCDDNSCFYTIPGTNGSSGSGILNSDGELVGILSIAIIGFNTITGGSSIESIKNIVNENLD